MSGTTPRQVQEPDITWTMPLRTAQGILTILAKQPFEQVNGVIHMLEEQGNQQVREFNEQQQRGNGADNPSRMLPS
jgi:hypothetical protein